MDCLETAFVHAQKDGLNLDGIVELFGSRVEVKELAKWLKTLYFDYARLLFIVDDKVLMPLPCDIEQQLYWLRQILEAVEEMETPNGRIKLAI